MERSAALARRVDWPRVVASGALWTVVYNLAWGVAWFTFMRSEWMEAVTFIGQSLPWTAEVWFMWVLLTFPIGVAISAHAASRLPAALRTTIYPAVAVWLMMTVGMAIWSAQESFPMRVIVMDSTVNLVGMLAASLACGWSLRSA